MQNYLHTSTSESTNKDLAQMIDSDLSDGFIVRTDFQSAGRGQTGNTWESEADKNLLFSMALFPTFIPPTEQFLLSKAISVGIVDALNHYAHGFEIKWPNDIFYQDKKVAGILIETAIMGSKLKHAIVGVGLNVNQTTFKDAPNATSLRNITGNALQRSEILDTISGSILRFYNFLKSGSSELINQTYCAHLYRKHGNWKFKDENGAFEAEIRKVENSGRLHLLDDQNTLRKYWMKEVEFII